MVKIAPSILSADFSDLAKEINMVEKSGADLLHIDVMDGHFVPNITVGPPVVASLRPRCKLNFDVHLMIQNPEKYIKPFLEAGADILTVHFEASTHLHKTLSQIRQCGAKAGVALNPATPPEVLQYILSQVDLVLIMTVNPGFGGQSFIYEMLRKISTVKRILETEGCAAEIEVDGGIDAQTAPLAAREGATILVSGSAIFGSRDPFKAIKEIKKLANGGE